MIGIFATVGFLAVLALVGYVIYLGTKHGWAWVAAQWKARKQKIAIDAAAVFAGNVAGATAPMASQIAAIQADVAAIKAKVGL
jgi:hypothetical protein